MTKPRIFLGSSGKQERLLTSLTNGLANVAEVVPWVTAFEPGGTTLTTLVELTTKVDMAAFVFAEDDWIRPGRTDGTSAPRQAAPRDNVVFEAGLFGGVLGMERTFILHADGAKLPSDLFGLTTIPYDSDLKPHQLKEINQKLRKAITNQWERARLEGDWWQYSQTRLSEDEPSAVSLLRIARERSGALQVNGRSWQEDGTLSAVYASEASRESKDPPSVYYFWQGERPRHPGAPALEGAGEIILESAGQARGYWTTRSDSDPSLRAKINGVYVRADAGDWAVLDSGTGEERAELIRLRLEEWNARANS